MRAVFKREFRACFQSVIGWLFLAATLAFYFLYFYVYNMSYGYPYIAYSLNAMTFLFLVTVPILTMRILAEERHAKTDQLILTAPVSVGKVVVGKYLALAAVFTIAMAVIGLTPLLLGRFGTVPYGESYVALLGFWLYGMACIAIGTFVSSLTESQVISAVLTFVFLFIGYMMEGLIQIISANGSLLAKILACYDLTAGLDKLSGGELDLTAVVYYVSLIVLFLFLTAQSIQKRRWSVSVKKLGIGIFNAGFVAAAIAAAVILNLVAGTLPSTLTTIDCTAAQLYAMTDDTKRVLSALDKQVELFVLVKEDSQDEQLGTTLDRYRELSSNIRVTYVDPAVSPNFYQKYTQDPVTTNSIIAVCGERSKVIDHSDIYETTVDYQTYQSQTTGYDAEGQLTSAVQYVTSEDMQTVYVLTGHGEAAISGDFREAVEKMNLGLQELDLLETDALPEDCEVLIIHGPTSDLSVDDTDKILQYLEEGGKVLVTTQYTTEKMEHFQEILSAYGLEWTNGVVVEEDTSHYYQNPMYLLPDMDQDTITSALSGEYVFVPYAQGLTYEEEEEGTVSYTPLLHTSDTSFVKTDVQNMRSFDKEEGDIDGPFTIGVAVADQDTKAQLVVYTSSAMFSEDADSRVSGHNSTLFAGTIGSLVEDAGTSNLVVIPVKEYMLESLVISQDTVILTGIFAVIVIPVGLLALGIVIWIRRRKA